MVFVLLVQWISWRAKIYRTEKSKYLCTSYQKSYQKGACGYVGSYLHPAYIQTKIVSLYLTLRFAGSRKQKRGSGRCQFIPIPSYKPTHFLPFCSSPTFFVFHHGGRLQTRPRGRCSAAHLRSEEDRMSPQDIEAECSYVEQQINVTFRLHIKWVP